MKKKALLGLAAALATAGALAAVKLLGQPDTAPAAPAEAPLAKNGPTAPSDPGRTVAFPLKNKYTGYSSGPDAPVYLFELETPSGTTEVVVSNANYEMYYIGDEDVCAETEKGLQVV